jgi:hypothetical protein
MLDGCLTSLESTLNELLALVDTLHRTGQCGEHLLLLYANLRQSLHSYVAHQRSSAAAIETFVKKTAMRQFQQCTNAYTSMYCQMYEAMHQAKHGSGAGDHVPSVADDDDVSPLSRLLGSSGRKAPVIKPSSVPLDPQSALHIIQCGPTVTMVMHNDNETLLKFPPSTLFNNGGIVVREAVEKLEAYYDGQCDAIYDGVVAHYDDILGQTVEEARLTAMVIDAVGAIELHICCDLMPRLALLLDRVIHDGDGDVSQLYEKTKDAINWPSLAKINTLIAEQRVNCRPYVDNVHAKFMVAVQLKDNMLRPYDLTRLRQQPTTGRQHTIGPVF